MNSLLPEVQEVFRDVFDMPDMMITPELDASQVSDWDSLTHINLIMAIERKYKVKFALGELKDMENVGDLLDILQKKIDAK